MTQPFRNPITIVECPRDAMQGLPFLIPTDIKVAYLNHLLKVGYDVLDFGSFVSPKAVPQMADTTKVLADLKREEDRTKLLAIVANVRGAQDALKFDAVDCIGYPFSLSETFQLKNTRKNCADSFEIVKEIYDLCLNRDKSLVVYLSMAFGNPYQDPWNVEMVALWASKFVELGVSTLSLADTVGNASPDDIETIFSLLIEQYPSIEFGAHFHAHPERQLAKIDRAYKGGCRRFDSAIRGFGGCPFAKDELVGNIATESLLTYCKQRNIGFALDEDKLRDAIAFSHEVFG